jgi:hypothetical protein
MPVILTTAQVEQALDRTHGRELVELLEFLEPFEGDCEAYRERASSWLLSHGKVAVDADS